MWMVLDRKTQLSIIVSLTIVLAILLPNVAALLSGKPATALGYMSAIVFILLSVAVGIFNFTWRYFWKKLPFLKRIYPDLNGTWRGTLHTTWIDPKTGITPGPIDTVVWIKQSLLSISVLQQTKESPSWSTRIFPAADRDNNRYSLWYSYDNKPHANVSAVSPNHEGVCSLVIDLDFKKKPSFSGQYYTSRKSSGNIHLELASPSIEDAPSEWITEPGAHEFRNGSGQ